VVQNYILGVPTDHYVNRALLALDWKVRRNGPVRPIDTCS